MASRDYKQWVDDNGALVDITDTALTTRDFYQIFVTPTEVVYRLWKIVPPTRPDNHPAPTLTRDTWEEFREDEKLFSEIKRAAGEKMLPYLLNIINGRLDYLPRLPRDVIIRIAVYLDLESMTRLGMTCRFMREIMQSNQLWEQLYRAHHKHVPPELVILARTKGWKEIFFTNKLQLQVQIRQLVTANAQAAATAHRPKFKSTTIF